MTALELDVQWALWSKTEADTRDYRTLGLGPGPHTSADLDRQVPRSLPGNLPGSRQPGPGDLPWLSFCPAEVAEADARPRIAASILDLSDVRDFAGRLIGPVRYFSFAYDDLAAGAVGYAALAAAVRTVALPVDRPGRFTVSVERLGSAELAERVDAIGFDEVARAAARLLTDRVDLGCGDLTLDDRLRWLDAIASLLPYGYRSDLTATTWSNTTPGRMRLAFTAGSGGRSGADRSTTPASSQEGGGGRGVDVYEESLRALRARRGTHELVCQLLARTAPMRFDARWSAVEMVHGLELVPAARSLGSVNDVREHNDRWERVVSEAIALIGLPGQAEALGRRVSTAEELGGAEQLLCRLVAAVPRMSQHGPAPAGVEVASANVAECLRRALESRGAVPPRDWGRLRDELLGSPFVLRALVALVSARSDRATLSAALDWLALPETRVPRWLSRLRLVVRGEADHVACGQLVRELSHEPGDLVRALFDAAETAGQLDRVVPALSEWLRGDGRLTDEARGWWLTRLEAHARPRPVSAATLAQLDLLFLTLGHPLPVPVTERLAPAGSEDVADYVRVFAAIHSQAPHRVRAEVAGRLVAQLERQTWWRSADHAPGVLDLLVALSRDAGEASEQAAFAGAITSALHDEPGLRELPQHRSWQALTEKRPDLLRAASLRDLRRALESGTGPDEIGAAVAAALEAGADHVAVVDALLERHCRDARWTEHLLASVDARLKTPEAAGRLWPPLANALLTKILAGDLGDETAKLQAIALVARMRRDLEGWYVLLPSIASRLGVEELRGIRDSLSWLTSEFGRLRRGRGHLSRRRER